MRVGALRHAADFPASRREVADDVAHVVGGRHDLHVHDRLEQDGVRLTGGLFHRHGPRDLERHFTRVYVVVRPVHQLDYHVHHRIAGEHAVLERFLDALLDRADVFPREYIGPVEQGVKEALENGVLAGYPMVDVIVELVDGSYHDVDSSEMAFKIAGSMAVKEAARQAHPVLLEPIMDVEVVTPADYMGDVIGDLSARRGKIGGMTQRADAHVVAASVPLSEMFGYSTTLRSMSQGRAIYSMQFSHYQEVPKTKAEEIVSKVKG